MNEQPPASVTPINTPSRAELWRRNQVALSILGHRPLLPTSVADELRRVLRGEDAENIATGVGHAE
jgi:hypothetical protein